MTLRETHERLLDIAIAEFGAKGLEGASTRSIAAAAGTAMSSITYHYGGKEGLYLAAAQHIAERMAEEMGAAAIDAGDVASADPAQARVLLHRIIGAFVDRMTSDKSEAWTLFIIREQNRPTEAFDRIYGGLMGQMMEQLAALILRVTGMADEHRARAVTGTLIGQALVLRASRAACLRLMRRETMDAELAATFRAQIAQNTDAILDMLTAQAKEPA
ncbi:CerR family C-terminal domain-containing protein [Sphingomonas sp.]|uniref:CerR family C-terminal domain-containing protein n=1 Tax=Sphingomonas sp. TaxID=28214 RepID=UPI001D63AE69|nr:CerR family C-terminal domain-containing protein [Sphingomonas sp.]MBX9796225.1 CerR family C-terminal domain-containing protein [Sphingomonas sp.]